MISPHQDGVTIEQIASRPAHVPFIVSFGGGVNSAALLVGLHERGLRPDLVTFADTGGEKPRTYAFSDTLQAWLASVGFPALTVVRTVGVRTGDKSLEDACRRLEVLPSRTVGLGTCALRWKIEPQEKHLRKWEPYVECRKRGDKPIRAIGYDAGEERRAKILEDAMCRYTFPLIEWGWTRDECVAAIQRAGLPVPPKSACFYCPSSTKAEVLELAQTHPLLFKRAVEMERAALASGKMHSVKGLGRHWSWEALVAADEESRKQFRERPVEDCTVCAIDNGSDV
jgi:hypothetical protein